MPHGLAGQQRRRCSFLQFTQCYVTSYGRLSPLRSSDCTEAAGGWEASCSWPVYSIRFDRIPRGLTHIFALYYHSTSFCAGHCTGATRYSQISKETSPASSKSGEPCLGDVRARPSSKPNGVTRIPQLAAVPKSPRSCSDMPCPAGAKSPQRRSWDVTQSPSTVDSCSAWVTSSRMRQPP